MNKLIILSLCVAVSLASPAKTTSKRPLATDVELVDGLTPEVHYAREEHIRTQKAQADLLPRLREDNYEVRSVVSNIAAEFEPLEPPSFIAPRPKKAKIVKKVDYPLASDIELINGNTPEVHFARQEHLQHLEEVRKLLPSLPSAEHDVQVPRKHVVHHTQEKAVRVPTKVREEVVEVPQKQFAQKNYEELYEEELYEEAVPVIRKYVVPKTVVKKVVVPTTIRRDVVVPATKTVATVVPVTKSVAVRKQAPFPLAEDVELIDGYTPEVWEARKRHLAVKTFWEEHVPKLAEDSEEEY